MHWVVEIPLRVFTVWKLGPLLISKMGACVSTVLETDSLKRRVAELEAQLAAGGGGGGGAVALPPAAASGAEALFFPDPAMPCRNGPSCRRQNCQYAHQNTSLLRLMQWLNAARHTLEVCVFSITCDELADTLLAAHNRGVKVRIISDNDQVETKGSDIERLKAAGVPVRVDHNSAHMHHKYALIDGRFLITGSFNWTRAGVVENQENVLILEAPAVVGRYRAQFDKLWAMYG